MENKKPIPQEIAENYEIARKYNVHIDVAVNPFIREEDRVKILRGEEQDPEWD